MPYGIYASGQWPQWHAKKAEETIAVSQAAIPAVGDAVTRPKLTRIFSSPADMNNKVDAALISGLTTQFPVEGRNYILTAENFRAERKDYTHEDEKKAILESRSLTYPIKADLKLIDKATGRVVDEQPGFSLMDSFHITGKHTLLYKGNNYAAANQLQLLPGVYTRTKDTGELETHFNTGSGASLHLIMNPQTLMFYLIPGNSTSKIPVGTLLTTVFGASSKEITQYIPADAWEANQKATAGKDDKYLKDMYNKLVDSRERVVGASPEVMAHQLKERLESSKLNVRTTASTLGQPIATVTKDAILLALRNLVQTYRHERQEDNRDSLQFKRVQNLPDFLTTRFAKEHQVVKLIKNRLGRELDRISLTDPKLKGNLSTKPFSKFYSNYIVASNLVTTPSETNPLESIENVAKVTVLGQGEGGIASDRGVPMGARDIDPSHLGIIDPSRTPESGHAGIDQRFTVSASRDAEGNLYARVRDKAGKVRNISVHEMMTKIVGFPNQEKDNPVQAQIKGELGQIDRDKVDYWLYDSTDMYTVTTNLVPFLNSNHPGRLTMAGKAIPQALSLVNREVPLVQTTNAQGIPFVKQLAGVTGTVAPLLGEVTKADKNGVTIRGDDGKIVLVKAVKNLPFNMKGFHDDETALVKVGDKVSPGQQLFESNYTKDGVLALGKNLEVAYIPWKGYNHEDGLVLSQSCAESLSSHHAYKIDYDVTDITTAKKALFTRWFPGEFTKEQMDKLDDNGYARVGSVLHHGDPCFAVLEKKEPTAEDKALGRMHKTLIRPWKKVVGLWQHDEDGKVVDAHTTTRQVRFILRSVKPLEVGDKLTGLHGNKGIVSLILPDTSMPYKKETGKPVDILLNPASVTSRVNLGQLMETAAAKIAQVKGSPYLVHNFDKASNVVELKNELAQHGISDTDELIDPTTKKTLGQVLAGPQYFIKLYKTSDQNWSARNTGGYDNVMQPTKGGEEGSKSIGYMEFLGLLGSNARKNLKEIATTKSESNEDFWAKFQRGEPLPKPKTTFATNKFIDYLTASGIKTSLRDGKLTASPLTDSDILNQSHGRIRNGEMINARNLEPDKGGLFDTITTGGLRGTNWTHYHLAEPVANPIFERPIKSILGLSTKEYEGVATGAIGVKKEGDVFHLHDIMTGNKIRSFKVNEFKNRPDVIDEPEEEEVEDDLFDKDN